VATILGVAFRDGQLKPIAFVGMALVVAGAYLTGRREQTVHPVGAGDPSGR
jgi:drug/metabolite transporter (DMT)-like permease